MYYTFRYQKFLCTLSGLVLAKKSCNNINNSRVQVFRLCYFLWLCFEQLRKLRLHSHFYCFLNTLGFFLRKKTNLYPPSASVSLNWRKDILGCLDQIWFFFKNKTKYIHLVKNFFWQQHFVKKFHHGRIWVKAVNFFRKSSILDVWLDSQYVFGGLCTASSTKGTSDCSCLKFFNNNQQRLAKIINKKLAVSNTADTLFKNQIFIEVFEKENYEYAALRKELFIGPFVERFKTTTLTKTLLINFINTWNKLLKYYFFLPNFSWYRRLSARRFTKGAVHCSFRKALLNRYFGKVLLIHFAITWNNLLEHIISVECLLMKDDVQGALGKELLIAIYC